SQWALYWVGYYLVEYLNEQHHRTAQLIRDPWNLRGQIIHFGDRYMFFAGDYRRLAKTNRLFLTWFHGEASTPGLEKLFEQLPPALPCLQTVVTSCQTSRVALVEGGIPDSKIAVIPIGVDLRTFTAPTPLQRERIRAELGIPKDAFVVGSFQKDGDGWGEGMSPKYVKGPDVFLEAMSHLKRKPFVL